jgi:hypothetical protein
MWAEVDFDARQVEVDFDRMRLSTDDILAAVRSLGFGVSVFVDQETSRVPSQAK